MASKKVYAIKSPKGNPVRCEEAWKDANGNVIADTYETKQNSEDSWSTRKAQEEKCYQALKTVTKDFTRTDPVYVRIGEDGEPEIHYTMTQENGAFYFANMDLGDATLYIHNGQICTTMSNICVGAKLKSVTIDSIRNCKTFGGVFATYNGASTLKSFYILDPTVSSSVTSSDYWGYWHYHGYNLEDGFTFPYMDLSNVESIDLGSTFTYSQFTHFPAWDLSKATKLSFQGCYRMQTMKGYGMKVSFNCAQSPLKHDAILEIFNNLGSDVAEGTTLTLGSSKLALMSDEEKKIATDKGWTLA